MANIANTTSEGYLMSTMEQRINISQNHSEFVLNEEMSVPLIVLSMVGLLANTLVIVVIVGSSLRHSVFMMLLIVLAVADSLALLSTDLLQPGVFGHIFA